MSPPLKIPHYHLSLELNSKFPQDLDKALSFGLLQAADYILETGCETFFHFLHLTFQEYLAALHLAKMSSKEQLMIFQYHYSKELTLSATVCRFFFGIYFSPTRKISTIGIGFSQILMCIANESVLSIGFETLLLCHCAYEAQSDVITDNVASNFDGLVVLQSMIYTHYH